MQHHEFVIGGTFFTAVGQWRCTDVGTRTIVAILIDGPHTPTDASWFTGPPYAVNETVFDEYDQPGCYLDLDDEIQERLDELDGAETPATIPSDTLFAMLDRRRISVQSEDAYPMRHFRADRGHGDARVHAYGAHRDDQGNWVIEIFHYARQALEEMPEAQWLALPRTDYDAPADPFVSFPDSESEGPSPP